MGASARSQPARLAAAALLILGGPVGLGIVTASPAAAAGDGTVCGRSPTDGAIVRYSGTPGWWQGIGNPPAELYGNEFNLLATNPATGHVFQYLRGTEWRWIGNPGSFKFVGPTVYGTPADQSVIMRFNGTPGDWTAIGGPHRGLSGGPQGLISTQPGTYAGFLYTEVPYVWTSLGRPPGNGYVTYTSTNTDIYAYDNGGPTGRAIYVRDRSDGSWVRIDSPHFAPVTVWSGGFGILAATKSQLGDTSGDVFLYTGLPGAWRRISSTGFYFVLTGRNVYRKHQNTGETYRWVHDANTWTKIHDGLGSIHFSHCP
ncbi:hypothetical protein [Streptosporangium roseum]|uniref:hypothetical protein n=1 Tax=Streptosporangium roseum TaxID=2001 RepID=UPI00332DA309